MRDWKQNARDSLSPVDMRGAAFIGLLLGLGTFWNGALIISALLILGSALLWVPHRTDVLVACVIATFLALLEAHFFVSTGPGVAPHFQFGFVAETPSVRGIVVYFFQLLGVLVPLLAIAMLIMRPRGRWLLASFLVPIAFATTFAFTRDVAVNHKFVNAAVRTASVFAALVVVRLLEGRRLARAAGIALIFALTITGAIDLISLWNFNSEKRTHNLADPLLEWAHHHTPANAVFAAAPIYHNLVYFTGRKSYLGLPYWAESTGYDVPPRMNALKRIYQGGDADEIGQIARTEHISYAIVDDSVRRYFPGTREDVIRQHFPLVFSSGTTHVYALPGADDRGATAPHQDR